MLSPASFRESLLEIGISRAVGVPDSTLEPFLAELRESADFDHIVATNECEALAIAMGQFMGSGRPSLVYLQNSGFGKTVHPITSLLCREVCAIPALLLIGWRGCPEDGQPDEPQHAKMGKFMPELLRGLDIPYEVLEDGVDSARQALTRARAHMADRRTPFALVVRRGLFGAEPAGAGLGEPAGKQRYAMKREDALRTLVEKMPPQTVFVSTTGKASRELFYIREARAESHDCDFYTVGGMGCASAIALGLARTQPSRTVCLIDGDGAALMHMGNLATIAATRPGNLLHVLIDNEAHESTGGQPTASSRTRLDEIALACGYDWARVALGEADFAAALDSALREEGCTRLIVVKARLGSNPALKRPTETPRQNIDAFMRNLRPEEQNERS